ncbi:uncharacterized protein LOC144746773 [Ciona intestinalis]
MWGVRMTDSTTQALLPHIDVMDKLDFDEEKLSARNHIVLHEAVERLTNPQGLTVNGSNGDRWSKYWQLYKNQPDDDVMQILQLPPGKIKELNIINVRMTDSTTQALLPHLDVMDKLGLVYRSNDINLNLYMEDISRKILDRQNKIQMDINAQLDKNATHWLARCHPNVSNLKINEEKLSVQCRIVLHEAVERLTNPQGLTVNGINGDRWSKYWKVYKDQPYDDVMQILQLPPGKIKVLNMRGVRMTDSTTQALLPHIDVMDKLGFVYGFKDMNLNLDLYMEDISRKILDRQNKIQIWMDGPAVKHVRPLFQCLDKISKLCLDMKHLTSDDLRLLEEAIQRLHSPQDFVLEEIAHVDTDRDQYLAQRLKFWNQ